MSQSNYDNSFRFVLQWEGSKFTNHPADRGGPTRYGVTQKVYNGYRQRVGKPIQSVEFIAMSEVATIFRRQYWDAVSGDALASPLDEVLFDTGVLMGPSRAIRFLQRALGVDQAGVIGPMTRAALAQADPKAIARQILAFREAFHRSIVANNPSQRVFLKGWLNRLNALRRSIGVPVPESAEDDADEANDDVAEAVGHLDPDAMDGDENAEVPTTSVAVSEEPFWLEPNDPSVFLAQARKLLAANTALYLVDITASSDEMLVASHPASPESKFQIPGQVVEFVTPISADFSGSLQVLVSVSFKAGFESLGDTFARIGVAPADSSSVANEADPAAPAPGEIAGDVRSSIERANEGAPDGDFDLESAGPQGSEEAGFEFPTMPLNIQRVRTFTTACMNAGVSYGLGAKVPFLGAVPGRDFSKVDCSGFIREAIRLATNPRVAFPDGSVVQHDWVRSHGYKRSTVDAGKLRDGAVRIAFLRPQDSPVHIGHVVLIYNGQTMESHGGHGPNMRPWTGQSWQANAIVYVLTAPTG